MQNVYQTKIKLNENNLIKHIYLNRFWKINIYVKSNGWWEIFWIQNYMTDDILEMAQKNENQRTNSRLYKVWNKTSDNLECRFILFKNLYFQRVGSKKKQTRFDLFPYVQ